MAKTVSFTTARGALSELLDEVQSRHEHVVITRNGRPAGVVVSSAEWESIQETLEVLGDEATLAALRDSEDDVRAGRLTRLEDARRELGLA
jgi:antitoxin YefM